MKLAERPPNHRKTDVKSANMTSGKKRKIKNGNDYVIDYGCEDRR
jgi:hypothetical protein